MGHKRRQVMQIVIPVLLLASFGSWLWWIEQKNPARSRNVLQQPMGRIENSVSMRPGYREANSFDAFPATLSELKQSAHTFVFGRVLDRNKSPVSGANVSVFLALNDFYEFEGLEMETESNPDGAFELDLDGGFKTGWLLIRKEGYAQLDQSIRIQSPTVLRRDYFLTEAAQSIAGQIQDSVTGRGISGARITLSSLRRRVGQASGTSVTGLTPGLSALTTETDSSGAYLLRSPPYYTRLFANVQARGYLSTFQTIQLDLEQQRAHRDFRLEPGHIASVWIADQFGTPIADATISDLESLPKTSDPQGLAELTLKSDSETHQFWVSASGYLDESIRIQAGASITRVSLREAPSLRGCVQTEDGDPISLASVGVWSGSGPRDRINRATSEDDGCFRVALAKLPVWSVRIAHPDYLSSDRTYSHDFQPDDLDVVLEKGSAGLYGRVLSSDGSLASFFSVTLRQDRSGLAPGILTKTFTDGVFSVLNLPDGQYSLRVERTDEITGLSEVATLREIQLREGYVYGQIPIQLRVAMGEE